MKKLTLSLFCFLILISCSKYRDYANEAINRYCPPELHTRIIEALNGCQNSAVLRNSEGLTKDECFAYVAVTFCPPKICQEKEK